MRAELDDIYLLISISYYLGYFLVYLSGEDNSIVSCTKVERERARSLRDRVVLGLRDTYFRQEVYSEDYPIGDNDDEVSSKNIERGEELAIKGVIWPLFLSVEKLLLFA